MKRPNFISAPFVDALYGELLERAAGYFLPDSRLEIVGQGQSAQPVLTCDESAEDGTLGIKWLGSRYTLSRPNRPFTDLERKLVKSIGAVLSARYQLVLNPDLAARGLQVFRGLPEDWYVSAFLDPSTFSSPEALARGPDRVASAIEVLRISSMTTYENRRIASGVLLFGSHRDPCHEPPPLPPGALPYSSALTSVRSFHRLCDGLQTVALVDSAGLLVELLDVHEWAQPYANLPLPVPSAARYQIHSRATLCGGHICLVLTPNGEIRIFANGEQVFNFLDGRWRLTDAAEKYHAWEEAVGDRNLAERLFTVALNLAEDRRGGLFVVLDDPRSAEQLVVSSDLVTHDDDSNERSKHQFHYLLRGKRVADLAPPVLETVARIDGAIVLDRESNLLAFGAILRHNLRAGATAEGGRATAALAASHFGNALKISEDGLISWYRGGHCMWEM